MIKSAKKTRNRSNVPQHYEGYLWQTYSQHHRKRLKKTTENGKISCAESA
jgi:uncharacterized protein YbgA (DUF1722 family)